MNLKIISLPCVIIVVVLAGYAVITAGTCWGINILEGALLAKQDKKMKADNDNEDPLARLEAEQQADRAKEQTEISKLEKELASLNAQATRSGNTLDMMLTIVNQRTKLQEQLEKLKIKQKKAEVKRRAAIAGLKKKIKKKTSANIGRLPPHHSVMI